MDVRQQLTGGVEGKLSLKGAVVSDVAESLLNLTDSLVVGGAVERVTPNEISVIGLTNRVKLDPTESTHRS